MDPQQRAAIQVTVSQMNMEDVEIFLMERHDHAARAFEANRMAMEDEASFAANEQQWYQENDQQAYQDHDEEMASASSTPSVSVRDPWIPLVGLSKVHHGTKRNLSHQMRPKWEAAMPSHQKIYQWQAPPAKQLALCPMSQVMSPENLLQNQASPSHQRASTQDGDPRWCGWWHGTRTRTGLSLRKSSSRWKTSSKEEP